MFRIQLKIHFFHLRNIARLRPMLSHPVAEKLINTFVFSRVDYCNALLAGVSKTTLSKLQSVQNSAARILTGTKTSEHISPVLQSLHWLPVRSRIDFKILMLTYKALHGLAPHYLSQLLSVYTPSRDLRSSDSGLLVIPPTRLRSMGDPFRLVHQNSGTLFLLRSDRLNLLVFLNLFLKHIFSE